MPNATLLLFWPPAVTDRVPVVAFPDSWTVMQDCPVGHENQGGPPAQLVTVKGMPEIATQDCPGPQFGDGSGPKLVPVITSPICTGPSGNEMLVI